MSSIITRVGIVLAGALILISVGCSKERTSGSGLLINPDTGKHPAQWASPDVHGAAAKGAASTSGLAVCQGCHNTDFSGGISKITCLNTAGCHGAGVMAPHSPKPWRAGIRTHTDTDPSNAPVCAQCHMNGGNSSVHPSMFDPTMAPGCFNNTMCHAAVAAQHPAGWALPTAHGVAAKSAPSSVGGFILCQGCHGNDFTGGNVSITCLNTAGCHGVGVNAPHSPKPWRYGALIFSAYTHTSTNVLNAPVCALCHTDGLNSSITPSPPAAAGTSPGCFNNTLCHAAPTCPSCHQLPPNGTASPNVAGQHAPHMAVSTVVACATCHNGAGFGTALHQNGVVDVIIDPTFYAESGTAAYNSASVTCSNISCHGGQTTPNWLSGTLIDVNTQCTACHVAGSNPSGTLVTPQYNSYWSGRHSLHLGSGVGAICTDCHDTTRLAGVHFLDLNTPAMINSYQTILSGLNYTGTATATGTCTLTCHSQGHTANQW